MELELYNAAMWGRTEEVRNILHTNPAIDVNWKSDNGKTALRISASWGFWEVVELLLKHGAVVDQSVLNEASYTQPRYRPGDFGMYYNNHNIDAKHLLHRTAKSFMEQARSSIEYSYILNSLEQDYAKLDEALDLQQHIPDNIMNIILYYNHFATIIKLLTHDCLRTDRLGEFINKYHTELLGHRATVDSEIGRKRQKFYNAAAYGDVDQVRRFLEMPDSMDYINWQNGKGNTALFIASAWGMQSVYEDNIPFKFFDTVKLLIEKGADVNLPNQKKQTPLYIAASWGHCDIVSLLLTNGAQANESILEIASYTVPRNVEVEGEPNMYYSAHTLHSKRHQYQIAMVYMQTILNNKELNGILNTVTEDYNRLIEAGGESVPDDIMNIIVYYNHFATIVELLTRGPWDLNVMLPNYNGKLLKHRKNAEIAINAAAGNGENRSKQEAI